MRCAQTLCKIKSYIWLWAPLKFKHLWAPFGGYTPLKFQSHPKSRKDLIHLSSILYPELVCNAMSLYHIFSASCSLSRQLNCTLSLPYQVYWVLKSLHSRHFCLQTVAPLSSNYPNGAYFANGKKVLTIVVTVLLSLLVDPLSNESTNETKEIRKQKNTGSMT